MNATLESLFKNEEIVIELAVTSFPAIALQKKYDGLRTIIMKSVEKIKIFSDSGLFLEREFPSLIKWMESHSWPADSFILDCEVDSWIQKKHRPREEIAARVHEHEPVPEGQFCVNVFDVLFFDGKDVGKDIGKDIHNLTQRERLEVLQKFDFGQSTIGVPDPKLPMNLAPSFFPETEAELQRDLNKCCKAQGSEGCVLKLLDSDSSRYSLSGASTAIVKLKNFAEGHFLVLRKNKTAVSPKTWTYEVGCRFTSQDRVPEKFQWELSGKVYHHVGRTYNTSIDADVGSILTVAFHSLNLYIDSKTGEQRLHLYEPKPMEQWREGALPDLFSIIVRIGRDSGLIVTKETVRNLDLVYPIPESLRKNFSPTYRRGEEYDSGILEIEKIPEGISPGRFIWFASDGEEDEVDLVESTD